MMSIRKITLTPTETYYTPIEIIDMQGHGVECAICGTYTEERWAVPWYEEPVYSDYQGEHGYNAVCKKCYDEWDTWDSTSKPK